MFERELEVQDLLFLRDKKILSTGIIEKREKQRTRETRHVASLFHVITLTRLTNRQLTPQQQTTMAKTSLMFSAFCILSSTQNVSAFSVCKTKAQFPTETLKPPTTPFAPVSDVSNSSTQPNISKTLATSLATIPLLFPTIALAVSDDLELAELPPPYVPIVVAIGVLGGVGALTASLGDVMDEGTCFYNSWFITCWFFMK
jgi:hypothetical protein